MNEDKELCPKCYNEVYLTEEFGELKYILCEHCNRKISVKDHGEVSDAELKLQRRSYMRKHIDQQEIKTSRSVPAEKLAEVY